MAFLDTHSDGVDWYRSIRLAYLAGSTRFVYAELT